MYEWLKAFHIIAVIAWMAAMLYLPRLFVYHTRAAVGSETSEIFKIMERRLYKAIMTPAMLVTWVLGLVMAYEAGWFSSGWFHAKLLLVFILSGVHGFMGKCLREFANDRNTRSEKFYRIFNEIPTVLMVFIVILVVLKPF